MKKELKAKFIWIPSIILLIISILLGICLGIMLSFLPFPERFLISQMSEIMITSGQAALLGMLYFSGTFVVISFLVAFSLAILALRKIFMTKRFFEYFVSFQRNGHLFLFVLFFYLCLSLIFILAILYYFLDYQKFLNNSCEQNYDVAEISMTKNYQKYKSSLRTVSIVMGTVIIASPTIAVASIFINHGIKLQRVPNRYDDIQQMYTFSSNQPNTMILYFDRGLGFIYNLCLLVDYCMFNEESFIVKYPEFTSYINVLSNSPITVGSNPSINGSWFMIPKLKNSDLINPFTNKPNNSMNFNEWFLQAYSQSMNLFEFYGYQNLGIYNAPYYDKRDYHNQANSQQLEHDLSTVLQPTTNIKVVDSSEVAKSLEMNPKLQRTDDTKVLQNFGAHSNNSNIIHDNIIDGKNYGKNEPLILGESENVLNLSVTNQSSTLLFNHFHITHETYTYIKDKNKVSTNNEYGINYDNPSIGNAVDIGSNADGLVVSIWYSLQKMKNIFAYLKNLPYDGENSDVIKNQYDNTNIYVIADHGYTAFNDSKVFHKILDYLQKNNYINESQINYLLKDFMQKNQDIYGSNPVFMVKERKYVHSDWNKEINTNDFVATFFNKDKILSLADFLAILDANLQKDQQDKNQTISEFHFDKTKSWFNNDQLKQWSKNHVVDEMISTNFLLDPLNQELSILNKRKIPSYGVTWKFYPNAKLYNIYQRIIFDTSKATNGIFTKGCLSNE